MTTVIILLSASCVLKSQADAMRREHSACLVHRGRHKRASMHGSPNPVF